MLVYKKDWGSPFGYKVLSQ